MTFPPLWIIALVCAALAPWAVRLLATAIERRLRRRTAEFLAGIPREGASLPQEKQDPERPT
ncbi:MAG TPA: hypothetical protein VIF09_13680 [Polyangiaceae bacterium]